MKSYLEPWLRPPLNSLPPSLESIDAHETDDDDAFLTPSGTRDTEDNDADGTDTADGTETGDTSDVETTVL